MGIMLTNRVKGYAKEQTVCGNAWSKLWSELWSKSWNGSRTKSTGLSIGGSRPNLQVRLPAGLLGIGRSSQQRRNPNLIFTSIRHRLSFVKHKLLFAAFSLTVQGLQTAERISQKVFHRRYSAPCYNRRCHPKIRDIPPSNFSASGCLWACNRSAAGRRRWPSSGGLRWIRTDG